MSIDDEVGTRALDTITLELSRLEAEETMAGLDEGMLLYRLHCSDFTGSNRRYFNALQRMYDQIARKVEAA